MHLLNHVAPVEFSRNREQHVVGLVTRLPEVFEIRLLQTEDTLVGSEYEAAQGSTLIKASAYKFENTTHRFVIATTNFLTHQITHLLELITRKSRGKQQFAEKLEGRIKLSIDDLSPDHSNFQARTCTFTGSQ